MFASDNADVDCRARPRHVEGKGGWEARRRLGRCDGERSVHGGTECWARHALGVRTVNMLLMSVTLDVSRLSGWLNADANCRVTPRHVEGDKGGWEARDAWWRCGGARSVHGGTNWTLGTARARGAHVKHVVHARDTGRVEAQRLVERVRALPSHAKARGGQNGGLGGAKEARGRV